MNRRRTTILLVIAALVVTACTTPRQPTFLEPTGQDLLGDAPPPTEAPARTVRLQVGDDFQDAVDASGAGSTYIIASGMHRLQRVRPRDGDTFIGEDGAIMSGTRVLEDFEPRAGRWVTGGQTQQGFIHGTTLPGREVVRHPEDLWIDDLRLRHVDSPEQVEADSWHFDYDADEIWIGVSPQGARVETSVTNYAFVGVGAADVTIRNLTVERYANRPQRGAINPDRSPGWHISEVTARENHGTGVGVGPGMILENAHIHDNGQIGIAGSALDDGQTTDGVIIRDVHVHDNGGIGFDWRWEAGGVKLKQAAFGMTVTRAWVHDNRGPGIWFDVDNAGGQITDSLVEQNTGPGLFYEISFGPALLSQNVVLGNGDDDRGVGVRLSSSSGIRFEDNVVADHEVALLLQQGNRGRSDSEVAFLLRDVEVIDNRISAPIPVVLQGVDPDRVGEDLRFVDNRYDTARGRVNFDVDGSVIDLADWINRGAEDLGSNALSLPPRPEGLTDRAYGAVGV